MIRALKEPNIFSMTIKKLLTRKPVLRNGEYGTAQNELETKLPDGTSRQAYERCIDELPLSFLMRDLSEGTLNRVVGLEYVRERQENALNTTSQHHLSVGFRHCRGVSRHCTKKSKIISRSTHNDDDNSLKNGKENASSRVKDISAAHKVVLWVQEEVWVMESYGWQPRSRRDVVVMEMNGDALERGNGSDREIVDDVER